MNKYTIEVSVTALCSSCGEELSGWVTESRPTSSPLERDHPHERKDRRAFIAPCQKCFVHKPKAAAVLDALKEVLPLVRHTSEEGWEIMKRARLAVENASE
jgi:hypothetical protein